MFRPDGIKTTNGLMSVQARVCCYMSLHQTSEGFFCFVFRVLGFGIAHERTWNCISEFSIEQMSPSSFLMEVSVGGGAEWAGEWGRAWDEEECQRLLRLRLCLWVGEWRWTSGRKVPLMRGAETPGGAQPSSGLCSAPPAELSVLVNVSLIPAAHRGLLEQSAAARLVM